MTAEHAHALGAITPEYTEKVPHLYERDGSAIHVCACGQPYDHACHEPFRAYEPRTTWGGDTPHASQDAVEKLIRVFDLLRERHQVDVMQSDLLACTCGERLPIMYGDDGHPLYNPAIRHHHEQYARAALAQRDMPTPPGAQS